MVGALSVAVLLVAAGVLWNLWRTHQVEGDLLRLPADDVTTHATLVEFANKRGPSLYAAHCAQCHGADMKGDATRGAPNLEDATWLFGEGQVSDIEATIQYGIRSGHPKAHNITDMPAFLRIGQLSPAEIDDVVEYVRSLGHQPYDADAARRGDELYQNKGNCYDCHSSDALGNPDYGAPALTGPTWLFGNTREILVRSVTNGRHGLCPAWIDKLSPAAVRELAIYLHSTSQMHRTSQKKS